MLSRPKVSMLRIQATPTCNLNCTYCYIPTSSRRQTGTMSQEVLETTLHRLIDEDLLEERLVVSWHGAEPLAAGLDWYKSALPRIDAILDGTTQVSHTFQTNGVLITDDWCEFFRRCKAHVGVSIDGSEGQNAARVNWAGRPTHASASRGIERLRRHGVSWGLLSVVSLRTMRDPRTFISFVRSTGCTSLGFKVEETNVAHESQLEEHADVESVYASFVRAMWDAFPADGPVCIREFEEYRDARRFHDRKRVVPVTLIPFRNLTVAVNGDFTIFSGELLFSEDKPLVFGNVTEGPLLDCLLTDQFKRVTAQMLAGVRRCADACVHYSDCGSFYISQKYAENGTFDADETLACRLQIKTLFRSLDEASGVLAPA